MMGDSAIKYQEGDLAAVPLRRGGYGIALVARMERNRRMAHKLVILYGFGDIYPEVPAVEKLPLYRASDAVAIDEQGDGAIAEGRWPLLGRLSGYRREDWPVPPFIGGRRGRQIIWLDNPSLEMEDVNAEVVTPEERRLLPKYRGAGDADFLSVGLDLAIRRRAPEDYIEVTEELVQRWREICTRVHEAMAANRNSVIKGRAWPAAGVEPLEAPIEIELNLKLSNSKMGVPADLEPLRHLEGRLEEELKSRNVGFLETAEIGGGYRRLIVRGKSSRSLVALIRRVLKGTPVRKGSHMRVGRLDGDETPRRIDITDQPR